MTDGMKLKTDNGPKLIEPETLEPVETFIPVPPQQLEHGAVQILPFLFLGSLYTAREENYLKSLCITSILNAAHDLENFFPASFDYTNVTIQDKEGTNIIQYFSVSNKLIEEVRTTGGTILVHCRGGVSRSVTLILAYLMWKYQLPLKRALNYMKERKPGIAPNAGFMEQLRKYEETVV